MDNSGIENTIVIGGVMGMCGELHVPAVLSERKETPYLMNRQLSGPQHSVR